MDDRSLLVCVLRPLGSTHSRSTVLGWLVGDCELAEISADHVKLDLNVSESFSSVDTHDVAHHLRHDDSVSKMSFDWGWLFSWLHISLGLPALIEEPGVLVFDF